MLLETEFSFNNIIYTIWLKHNCAYIDGSAHVPFVAAGDINHLDEYDEEAQNILEDMLKPQKYDPLEFWNHIQSQVYNLIA